MKANTLLRKTILLMIVSLAFLFTGCGTVKKLKSQIEEEKITQIKKDSIAAENLKQKEIQIETLSSENKKLKTVLSEKSSETEETESEVKLKPKIDPETGKLQPASYTETKNGQPVKTISITGDGEVIIKSKNTIVSEKEKTQSEQSEQSTETKYSERILEMEKLLDISATENKLLKSKLSSKTKEVEKSFNLFWYGFVFGIFFVILILIIYRQLKNKTRIFDFLNKNKPV